MYFCFEINYKLKESIIMAIGKSNPLIWLSLIFENNGGNCKIFHSLLSLKYKEKKGCTMICLTWRVQDQKWGIVGSKSLLSFGYLWKVNFFFHLHIFFLHLPKSFSSKIPLNKRCRILFFFIFKLYNTYTFLTLKFRIQNVFQIINF